ncbi:MAG: hypothetical protein ACYCVD_12445 [Desulfitobacteriaceae bacterium]
MEFDQKRVVTLVGTLVLAGAVVAAGIYGPSAWKVLRPQTSSAGDQVLIQNPPIDPGGGAIGAKANPGTSTQVTPTVTVPAPAQGLNAPPQGDVSGVKKYKEPDVKLMDLAPSIAGFFSTTGESGLSEAAKNLAYGSAWNIHQYVDGYLFGPTAGPQMNEQDIKKYIVFFKSVWDKQLKSESGAAKATAFSTYLDVLFNRGADAFDSKDKARIEQFHQEIHDLDEHLFRNNASAKIYGATPFATKR